MAKEVSIGQYIDNYYLVERLKTHLPNLNWLENIWHMVPSGEHIALHSLRAINAMPPP